MDVKNLRTAATVGGMTDHGRIDVSNTNKNPRKVVSRGYMYVNVHADGTLSPVEPPVVKGRKEPSKLRIPQLMPKAEREARFKATFTQEPWATLKKNLEAFLADSRDMEAERARWEWVPNNRLLPEYEDWCKANGVVPVAMQTLSRALRASDFAEKGDTRRRVPAPGKYVNPPQWGYYLPPRKG